MSLHIQSQFDLIENIYGVLQNVSRSNFNCAEKCTLDLYYKQALRNRLLEISDRTQYEESRVLQNLSTIITQGLSSSYNIVYVTWSRIQLILLKRNSFFKNSKCHFGHYFCEVLKVKSFRNCNLKQSVLQILGGT